MTYANGLHIGPVLVENGHDVGHLHLLSGGLYVKTCSARNLPNLFDRRGTVRGPDILVGIKRLQHRFKDALQTRGFQDLDGGFRREAVKRRIAQHDPYIIGVLSQDVFHDRMKGTAGFAGWVEKLDNGYRRIVAAERRRVWALQELQQFG